MAITRTAKGTAQSKAATTSLTLSSVSLTAGDLLVVGIGYETDAALNSVQWGSRNLKLVADSGATRGDTRVRLYRARVRDTATRDITVTWAGNMSARAMFATAFTEVGAKDVGSTADFAAGTTAPNTGTAVTSTIAATVSVAAMVSGGPSGDTAGTAGDGHTLGQRVGTTGGGAATNVTIQETFEILAATGDVRSSLTGATGRIWACSIAAFGAVQTYTVKDVYQPLNTLVHGDDIVFVMEGDTVDELIHVRFPIATFDNMTDAEVTEQVADYCIKHAEHILEGPESNPVGDATRNSRMSGFVNDTVIV